MASRISEQIIEWLTVGGNAFSSQTNVPLLINKVGVGTATIPTTSTNNFIAQYINQGQIWILGAVAASADVKSSQIIVSSSDAGAGGAVGLELWRGTNASWQIINSSGDLYIRNNYTSSAQTTYSKDGIRLSYNGGATSVTYGSRTIKPILHSYGILYSENAIESLKFFMQNVVATTLTDNGYWLRANNVTYGRFYINAAGTANSGTDNATRGALGSTVLDLGNNINWPAAGTAGGANNARGVLGLYGENTYKVSFMTVNQAAARSFYIPKLETTGYAMPTYDLSGAQDLNTKYDAGIYCIEGGSVTNYPSGSTAYANLLVIPYRKPSGNSKPDYAIQIYSHSNTNRLWFRGSSADSWAAWREVASIAANTAVGSGTRPVYVTSAGVITALSYTANRLYYSASTSSFEATSHYASTSKIAINSTSEPGYNLYVNGTTYHSNTITTNMGAGKSIIQNIYNSTTYPLIYNHNNGNISLSASSVGLYLGYDNTTLINFLRNQGVWNSTGLGIGTTSPSYKLHVVGDIFAQGVLKLRSSTPQIDGLSTTDGTRIGIIFLNTATVNSLSRANRYYFRMYSHNSSTGAILSYYDQYRLPVVATDKTENTTYDIWNSNSEARPTKGTASHFAYYSGTNTISAEACLTTNNTGDVTLTSTGSNRARFYLNTASDNPNDLYFKTNNANQWSISARGSADSYYLGIYKFSTDGWHTVFSKDGNTEIKAGLFKITKNSNTVTIGSQNADWCHIYNSANIPFIFNNTVAQTTGNLGTDVYPWGTFYWKGLSYVRSNRSRYSYDLILQNGAGNTFGEMWYDRGNASNITMGSWRFREYSPNSTADTATTGYYEDFYLPNVTTGRTASATYNILTTKAAVTVAQGGTGATSAAGARANLYTWALVNDSYPTIMPANGTTNNWFKIGTANTSYGIIPSQSSANTNDGHNYIGTSSWFWAYSYITTMISHNIYLQGETSATMSASSTNPRITFREGTDTQPVHLIYTDYDSYRSPAGLKVIGGASASPAWFEVEGACYAASFNGPLNGNATSASRAGFWMTYSTNEVRFYNNGFTTSDNILYIGHKWSDGSTSPLIKKYVFRNANGAQSDIYCHTYQTQNYGTGAPGSSTHQNGAGSLYFQYIN